MASKRKADSETFSDGALKRTRSVKATPPPRASLLGLPPELRNRIYHYVFSDNLIHITTRPCKPYDKGAFRSNVRQSSWGPLSRSWKKWTHTICQVPGDWEQSYRSSKDADGSVPRDYFERHDTCSWIQDDFQDRAYNFPCEHSVQMGYRHHGCLEQLKHAESMQSLYGRAEEGGLERFHASSKLHLEVLLVCRQIYQEAALLPYSTNIFNFDYPTTLQDFLGQGLVDTRQIGAVQMLQTGSWLTEDICAAKEALYGLKYLQYSGEQGIWGKYYADKQLEQSIGARIEKVEVILSPSGDLWRDAKLRRQLAEEAERYLMGHECKELPSAETMLPRDRG